MYTHICLELEEYNSGGHFLESPESGMRKNKSEKIKFTVILSWGFSPFMLYSF